MNEVSNYIKQWIELAEGDFLSAKHLLTLYPHKLEVICYLCEQSAEKIMDTIQPKMQHVIKELEELPKQEEAGPIME